MTNSSAPTAAPNLPCREFPCNAPDHIDDDTDARDKGEITLAEAQAQLKKIQSGAKRAGLVTREQAFSRG